MVPPKLSLMPMPRMKTRERNKDAHPGLVDIDPPSAQAKPSQEQKQLEDVRNDIRNREKALASSRLKERAANEINAALGLSKLNISDCDKEESNQSSKKTTKPKPSDDDFFVSDKENANIPVVKTRKRKQAVADDKSSAFRLNIIDSSSGEDGSNFEDEDESSSSDTDTEMGDDDVEEEEEEEEEEPRKKRKKANSSSREKKKASSSKSASKRDAGKKNKKKKKKKASSKPKKSCVTDDPTLGMHGLEYAFDEFIKQRATNARAKKVAAATAKNDDNESMVKFGGMIPEGQTDEIEATALTVKPEPLILPTKKSTTMVKIEDNGIVQPKTKKEARSGDDKWKLKHLDGRELEERFTCSVAPQACKKTGSLAPWDNLSVNQIKEIVDEVFGDGVHQVAEDGVWVNQRLHSWRGDFAQKAQDMINLLVEENRAVLNTKELVAEQMATYLQKVPVWPGSDLHTYAYQWLEWDTKTNKREGFCLNPLVLRMFALAHLALLDGIDDFSKEKPIGALILSMQAVGRALEHCKDGEKPSTKPPAFSADNFDDKWVASTEAAGARSKGQKKRIRRTTIFVQTLKDLEESQWDMIINNARAFLDPKKRSRDRSSSATVAVEEEEEEDPDADFVMKWD